MAHPRDTQALLTCRPDSGLRLTALHVPEDLVVCTTEPLERLRIRAGVGGGVRVARARARAVRRLDLVR